MSNDLKLVVDVPRPPHDDAYYLQRNQVPYRDLGPLYFARLDQDRTAQRLARRIRELGYEVEIRKAA